MAKSTGCIKRNGRLKKGCKWKKGGGAVRVSKAGGLGRSRRRRRKRR